MQSAASVARIEDYAIVGNCRSAALISRAGSIDWLCWPRFESPSLFAAILDETAGRWLVAPTGRSSCQRGYVDHTNILVTEMRTAGGVVRLTDFMPVYDEADKRRMLLPEHELVRIVECTAGQVEVESRFEPRPDYARRSPRLHRSKSLGVRSEQGASVYTLRAETELELDGDQAAVARMRLRSGERRAFSLCFDTHAAAVLPPLGDRVDAALASTSRWWRRWAERCRYAGPHRDAVIRSLLVAKLLVYAPSGAIVAAPTTSLPEALGGPLNWDYRYCWLRDAALTVAALLELGYEEEAKAFEGWLLHGTRLTRPRLGVLYDVFGRQPRREQLLDHLVGHRGSSPVRIRNAASSQLQLDVYGEVIDAVARICRRGAGISRESASMLREFGRYVCENWWRPDQGIWEPRGEPQHYTHSRVLCWTALDRLLELHRKGMLAKLALSEVHAERERIRRDVEEHCFNQSLGAYTQVRGGDTLDASSLMIGWHGFAQPACPRMRQTFALIRERLEVAPALLLRNEQSRDIGEGAFGICGFWAAEHLARGGGSLAEAERWFELLLGRANDVGLYAEEIDPATGAALGNVPQAFTHVGLLSAANAIERRRESRQEMRA